MTVGEAQWYIRCGGQQFGPVTAAKIARLAIEGRLSGRDQVWRDGLDGWIDLGMIASLPADGAARGIEPATVADVGPAPQPAAQHAKPISLTDLYLEGLKSRRQSWPPPALPELTPPTVRSPMSASAVGANDSAGIALPSEFETSLAEPDYISQLVLAGSQAPDESAPPLMPSPAEPAQTHADADRALAALAEGAADLTPATAPSLSERVRNLDRTFKQPPANAISLPRQQSAAAATSPSPSSTLITAPDHRPPTDALPVPTTVDSAENTRNSRLGRDLRDHIATALIMALDRLEIRTFDDLANNDRLRLLATGTFECLPASVRLITNRTVGREKFEGMLFELLLQLRARVPVHHRTADLREIVHSQIHSPYVVELVQGALASAKSSLKSFVSRYKPVVALQPAERLTGPAELPAREARQA